MKNLILSTVLLANLLVGTVTAFTQTIEYKYDLAGNRYLRQVVTLEKITPTDTSNTPADTNQTNNTLHNTATKATETYGKTTVSVFPNPTPGVVQIEVTGEMPQTQVTMQVFNLTGKTIVTQLLRESSAKINLSGSPSGEYILKISWSGQTKEWVLVKQ